VSPYHSVQYPVVAVNHAHVFGGGRAVEKGAAAVVVAAQADGSLKLFRGFGDAVVILCQFVAGFDVAQRSQGDRQLACKE
jgi:hypothetical protein